MDYGVAPESAVEAKSGYLNIILLLAILLVVRLPVQNRDLNLSIPLMGNHSQSSRPLIEMSIKQLKPLKMLSKVGRLSILTKERRYYTQLRGFYRKILVFFLFLKQSIMASQ